MQRKSENGKTTHIDQLPAEMLLKIFSYLPTYGEVSVVNRIFYRIACAVNDSNICLRVDRRFCKRFLRNNVISSQWRQSVLSSNRQIATMEIVSDNPEDNYFVISNRYQGQIISVITRFSETITVLKLVRIGMDMLTFLEILSLIPNVEHMDLHEICTIKRPSKLRCCYVDLNLKKLKSLVIVGCSSELILNFDRLPAGVLTDLQISCHWSTLSIVLNRQFNIKKLVYVQDGFYRDDALPKDIFDNLKLNSLLLYLNDINSSPIPTILAKQTELKSLILNRETSVSERAVNAVTDLSELEILSMNVTETRTSSLEKILKLKKLQDLRLQCIDNASTATIRTFAESTNNSIKKLSLHFGSRIPIDLVGALARSAPNLTHLNVLPNFVHGTNLDAILCNFNFLEVLHVSLWGEPLHPGNYFNAKLKELAIFVPYADHFYKLWLAKLIAVYPNLQKFTVITRYADARFRIGPILDGFSKLESLTLDSSQMIVDDLDYLHDQKNNLKFLSVGRLDKVTFTDELVKKLREDFGVVNVDYYRTLSVAVDRYTMKCERNP